MITRRERERVTRWAKARCEYGCSKCIISSSNFDSIEDFARVVSSFEAPSGHLPLAALISVLLIEFFDVLQGVHILGNTGGYFLKAFREVLRSQRPLLGIL